MSVEVDDAGSRARVFDAFSVPVAVLDAQGRYLYLNAASRTDPVLALGRIGATDFAGCREDEQALQRARRRRAFYDRATAAHAPVCFSEALEQPDGTVHEFMWLCLSTPEPEGDADEVTVIGFDVTDSRRHASEIFHTEHSLHALVQRDLIRQLVEDLLAPMAAMAGLALGLAEELSGEHRERAVLIERAGQQLLQRLRVLSRLAESENGFDMAG